MRVAGNTHCHAHSRPAFGYFRASAHRSSTQPAPWRRSASCCLPDHLDMPDEIGFHHGGQHRHAVTIALTGAHDDLIGGEVHVLHSEAGTLEQTQPCAVEQDGHEPRRALELSDDGTNLLTSQDDGEPLAALGADHVVKPGHLELEDLTV